MQNIKNIIVVNHLDHPTLPCGAQGHSLTKLGIAAEVSFYRVELLAPCPRWNVILAISKTYSTYLFDLKKVYRVHNRATMMTPLSA